MDAGRTGTVGGRGAWAEAGAGSLELEVLTAGFMTIRDQEPLDDVADWANAVPGAAQRRARLDPPARVLQARYSVAQEGDPEHQRDHVADRDGMPLEPSPGGATRAVARGATTSRTRAVISGSNEMAVNTSHSIEYSVRLGWLWSGRLARWE